GAKDAQTEAAHQKEEADKAVIKNNDAHRELAKSLDRLRQFSQTQQQFADKEKELARKENVSARRAEHITKLRGKLIDTANNLLRSTDLSVTALGRQIIEQSSLEVTKLLGEYAKQPVDDTGRSLDELIGTPENILDDALRGGLGFAFWQKYSDDD